MDVPKAPGTGAPELRQTRAGTQRARMAPLTWPPILQSQQSKWQAKPSVREAECKGKAPPTILELPINCWVAQGVCLGWAQTDPCGWSTTRPGVLCAACFLVGGPWAHRLSAPLLLPLLPTGGAPQGQPSQGGRQDSTAKFSTNKGNQRDLDKEKNIQIYS